MPGFPNLTYTYSPQFGATTTSTTTDYYTNATNWLDCLNTSNTYIDLTSTKDIKEIVEQEMDKQCRKIYNLIKDLVQLNTTEDEFIELLHEMDD